MNATVIFMGQPQSDGAWSYRHREMNKRQKKIDKCVGLGDSHRREHGDMSRRKDLGLENLCYPSFHDVGWGRVTLKLTTCLFPGVYRKPSLSALPAPPINSGEMMTLKCCSDVMFETFILVVYREDVNEVQMRLAGEPYAGGSQVNISIAPVTAAHAGTYRCYSSSSQHSHVWSHPSDPLDIVISGESFQTYSLGSRSYMYWMF